MSELEPRFVREGEGSSPFFSPDSKWLGFWANGSIWKMRVDGTQHEPICDAPNQLRGASWGDDNRIVFTDGADGALRRVRADGGTPTVLTSPTADVRMYYFPHVLPGSKAAFVMLLTKDPKTIGLVSLETGAILHTLFAGSTPRFVQGFLVFRRFETLHAAPFDLTRPEGDR